MGRCQIVTETFLICDVWFQSQLLSPGFPVFCSTPWGETFSAPTTLAGRDS